MPDCGGTVYGLRSWTIHWQSRDPWSQLPECLINLLTYTISTVYMHVSKNV